MSQVVGSVTGRLGSVWRRPSAADARLDEFPESAEAAPPSESAGQRLRGRVHAVSGAIEDHRIANDLIVEAFLQRARRAGADEVLLDHGRRLPTRTSMIETIAYFRLLVKVSHGAIRHMTHLLRKFGPEPATPEEFASILRLLGAPVDSIDLPDGRHEIIEQLEEYITAEVKATGGSSIFQWLAVHGAYDLHDPELDRYVHHRLFVALRARRAAETPTCSDELAAHRARLLAAIARHGNGSVFVAGTTLLAHETDHPQTEPTTLQFGTFHDTADLTRQLADSPIVVLRRNSRRLVVSLPDSPVTGCIEAFTRRDDVVFHGDGIVTRWHTPFGLTERDGLGLVPDDTDLYLSERFGNWTTPTLFYDDHLDAPNTTFDPSLESMFALSRRTQNALSKGIRHFAEATTAQLRDVFDIDFSMFMPQPAHRKSLSLPFAAQGLADRPVVVVAGEFATLDAAAITSLEALADESHRLVLAVPSTAGTDGGLDRMATVKTLKVVDHVLLYAGVDTLLADVEALGARELIIGDGAGFERPDVQRDDLDVTDMVDKVGGLR